LPALIALCEDHAEHRDKFEVFAIHDKSVKSFDELDKKLASIKKQHWQGKDLPFPEPLPSITAAMTATWAAE